MQIAKPFVDLCKTSSFENISYEITFRNYIEIFVKLKYQKNAKNAKKKQKNMEKTMKTPGFLHKSYNYLVFVESFLKKIIKSIYV